MSVINTQLCGNTKQIQKDAYLHLVSEQLSNADINVQPTLITQILNYIEENQNQLDHVGVIMDNLAWYALACHYYDFNGQLPERVQITNTAPQFPSAKELLDVTDYKTLTLCFTINKPKKDPDEVTIIEYINHTEYLKALFD
ncbi:MAG: hypothetical protein O2911_09350, partial [Bacteroidetes bacterium]|nr:hypothetical protein [Bacteroidota bacterium]